MTSNRPVNVRQTALKVQIVDNPTSTDMKKNFALVLAALILVIGSVYAIQHGALQDVSDAMYHHLRMVASNSQTF